MAWLREKNGRDEEGEWVVVVTVELTEAAGSWTDLAPAEECTVSGFGTLFPSRYLQSLILISAIMSEDRGRHRVEQWDGPVALSQAQIKGSRASSLFLHFHHP